MEQLQLSVGCDSWSSGTSPLGKTLHTCYTIFIPNKGNHMTNLEKMSDLLIQFQALQPQTYGLDTSTVDDLVDQLNLMINPDLFGDDED